MTMRLWHDDIRPAPASWVWARTNEEAKKHLRTGTVEYISMDHDLGEHGLDPAKVDTMTLDEYRAYMSIRGTSNETGLDLARWMALEGIIPEKIVIHSWNPAGAAQMAAVLREAGGNVTVRPFVLE